MKEYSTFPKFQGWSLTIICSLVSYSGEGFKYCSLTQLILFNINHLFVHSLNVFTYCYLSANDPQPPPNSTFKIKWTCVQVRHTTNLKNMVGTIASGIQLSMINQLIRLASPTCRLAQKESKWSAARNMTTSVARSLTSQWLRSHP